MTYGIEQSVYEALLSYFEINPDIQKVTLFGSRATNLYTTTSDIDLCLKYTGTQKATVIFDIEDRVGIYDIDIVFEGSIGEELARQIARDGKVIYKGR